MTFTSNARVVRSIDFILTLVLGVIGEFMSLSGLKFSTLDTILFATTGRRCINTPKLFRTDVTNKASLYPVRRVLLSNANVPDL